MEQRLTKLLNEAKQDSSVIETTDTVNYLLKNNVIAPAFKTGDTIYVVVGDDDVLVYDKVIFLAQNDKCVIATYQINDYNIDDIVAYHIEQTQENLDTKLLVFPIKECFATKEDVEQYMSKTGDSNG